MKKGENQDDSFEVKLPDPGGDKSKTVPTFYLLNAVVSFISLLTISRIVIPVALL